jgi:short subunit dehydrogenase-like uncharacterized protein
MPKDREYALVVWGATGFTGRLTAEYLIGRYGVGENFPWAIAGRNPAKLEAVREEIGAATGVDASALPMVVGDGADEEFLRGLAARTGVVCTAVGPYALYGSNLVAACVEAGTDYCDLTGEVQWMARMIAAHDEAARQSGARIVFTCGFDCIPADIGAYFVHTEMKKRHGVPAGRVKFRVHGFSGGASGGTIASMIQMMEEASADPSVLEVMRDPYALNPIGLRRGPDGSEPVAPFQDEDFGQWAAPFVMGAVDTKVVRRSNALLDYAYGRDFRYDEAVLCGTGPGGLAKATGSALGTPLAMGAMSLGPVRRFAARRLPQPGEGPDRAQREAGFFDIRLLGFHPTDPGLRLEARIFGDRDPGYGSTSKMLGESAVALALDEPASGGGCLTPASAIGDSLLVRLPTNAGVSFNLE